MSCNTKTSLAAVIDAVNAQLNNNYVDRDDPRINQGVFTEPTIRGGLMLDEAAKLDFCGYVIECGQQEPFGKQWIDRPLYPYNTLVSYEDGGEIKSHWQDIDDVVAGTEIGESYIAYEETRRLGLQGYAIIDSFELGATLTQRNEALRHAADGKLYRWAGDLPKTVPANSTPSSSGGFGTNAWLEVSDTTLRQDLLDPAKWKDIIKGLPFVTAEMYGAKGDGIADDTAAIQKALDYIDNLGGGTVILPRGTYKTTYTLLVGDNTHLKGEGNPVIMSAPNMAITTKNVLTGSVFKNVHYSGIELTTCANGFGLFHVDNGSIINCSSSDIAYHLTDIAGCTQVLVSQCTSVGNYTSSAYQIDGSSTTNAHNISLPDGSVYYSAQYDRVSTHIYLVFNTCINAKVAVEIHKTGVEHVYIDRNLFSTDGVITTAKGVDINYNIISRHIHITNNTFKGRFPSGGVAVGRNVSYLTITGNTFEAEESGLLYCRGVIWDGAAAAGSYHNISNNKFIHISQPISATNASDIEIRNNIIVGASKVGSFTDEAFSYTDARDASLFAISVSGAAASRVNIVDNIFVDTPHSCIRMNYLANTLYVDVTVSGNRTINSGKLLHIKGASSGKTKRLRVTNNILGYSIYQYYAIDITNVYDAWISDNVIAAHKLYSLTLTNSDNVRVSDNIVDLASYTTGSGGSPYNLLNVTNLDFYDNKVTNTAVGEAWLSILGTSTGKIKFEGSFPTVATTSTIKADFSAAVAPTTPRFADGSVAVATDGGTDTYAWVRASGTWKALNYAV